MGECFGKLLTRGTIDWVLFQSATAIHGILVMIVSKSVGRCLSYVYLIFADVNFLWYFWGLLLNDHFYRSGAFLHIQAEYFDKASSGSFLQVLSRSFILRIPAQNKRELADFVKIMI